MWPLPTAAVVTAGGKIQLLCSKETDDITAINDEYQHLPILYAVGCAKQKDEKFDQATNIFTQFFADIAFEREDKINRETDTLSDFQIRARSAPRGGGQSA